MPKQAERRTRCYILVAYGDRVLEQRQRSRYEATLAFLKENAAMYGLPDALDTLSEAEAGLLEETFEDARICPPDALASCRLEIELHVDAAPRACDNFSKLCEGFTNKQGVEYSYKDTPFHRYVPKFCIQGGDINGRGGDSIYGGAFKDEREGLKLAHSFGCVSMANSGPNTNRSQFFICLSRESTNASIDGRHVVFGRVVNDDGLRFLEQMDEELEQAENEGPKQDVFVADAGVYE